MNTALPNKSICISVGTVVVVPTALSVVRGGLGNGGIVIVEGTLVKGIDDGIETISRICLLSECQVKNAAEVHNKSYKNQAKSETTLNDDTEGKAGGVLQIDLSFDTSVGDAACTLHRVLEGTPIDTIKQTDGSDNKVDSQQGYTEVGIADGIEHISLPTIDALATARNKVSHKEVGSDLEQGLKLTVEPIEQVKKAVVSNKDGAVGLHSVGQLGGVSAPDSPLLARVDGELATNKDGLEVISDNDLTKGASDVHKESVNIINGPGVGLKEEIGVIRIVLPVNGKTGATFHLNILIIVSPDVEKDGGPEAGAVLTLGIKEGKILMPSGGDVTGTLKDLKYAVQVRNPSHRSTQLDIQKEAPVDWGDIVLNTQISKIVHNDVDLCTQITNLATTDGNGQILKLLVPNEVPNVVGLLRQSSAQNVARGLGDSKVDNKVAIDASLVQRPGGDVFYYCLLNYSNNRTIIEQTELAFLPRGQGLV